MASPSAFTHLPKSNVARFTLEGLIGAGKSRFLEALKTNFASSQKRESIGRKLTIVDEPVEKWCSTKDEAGKSVLSYFYDDTERYGFLFQINALMTRYGSTLEANDLIEQKLLTDDTSHVLLSERTIGTDRNVFAKMLNDDGKLNSMEYLIYQQTFDTLTQRRPECNSVDGVIFIHTTPEESMRRIIKRGREGENIPLDYLVKCAAAHQEWLPNCEVPVLIVNGNINIGDSPELYANLIARSLDFMNCGGDVYKTLGWTQNTSSSWDRALELALHEGIAVFEPEGIKLPPTSFSEPVPKHNADVQPTIPKYMPPLEEEIKVKLCDLKSRQVIQGVNDNVRVRDSKSRDDRVVLGTKNLTEEQPFEHSAAVNWSPNTMTG